MLSKIHKKYVFYFKKDIKKKRLTPFEYPIFTSDDYLASGHFC